MFYFVNINTAAIASGREHWLYYTVPEVPVAGADCVFYYNKAQSEVLRYIVFFFLVIQ